MKTHRLLAVRWMTACTVIVGCASSPHAVRRPPEPTSDQYRPDWTAAVSLHISEIRACLADRQEPVAVVHLQDLATGATGVTAVDGFGALENCAAKDSAVLLRGPSAFRSEDLAGLPLFALGPGVPRVATGVVLEEVTANEEEDVVLGWLYWPHRSRTSSMPNQASANGSAEGAR